MMSFKTIDYIDTAAVMSSSKLFYNLAGATANIFAVTHSGETRVANIQDLSGRLTKPLLKGMSATQRS